MHDIKPYTPEEVISKAKPNFAEAHCQPEPSKTTEFRYKMHDYIRFQEQGETCIVHNPECLYCKGLLEDIITEEYNQTEEE